MRKAIHLAALVVISTVTGCQKGKDTQEANTPSAVTPTAESTAKRIVLENVGFATPESVLYDAQRDIYLVTNINGSPLAADGNGFISRVNTSPIACE